MAMRSLMPFPMGRWMMRRHEAGDPFVAFRREMDRLFEDLYGGVGMPAHPGQHAGGVSAVMLTPRIDVSETESEFRIEAELPGIDEEDVKVTLNGDLLTIRGETEAESEEDEDENANYHVIERAQGTFARTVRLPFAVEADDIEAEFKNGVLTVTIAKPREEQEKTQRIEVKTEGAAGTPRRKVNRSAAGDKPASGSGESS